jgi:hypothetical protein
MTASSNRKRPRVICHMMTSTDGRIVTDGWPMSAEGRRQYELVHTRVLDGKTHRHRP